MTWNLFLLEFTRRCSPTDGLMKGKGGSRVRVRLGLRLYNIPVEGLSNAPSGTLSTDRLDLPCDHPAASRPPDALCVMVTCHFLLLLWEHNRK